MDESGNPVSGAEVYAIPKSAYALPRARLADVSEWTRTGEDGHFEVRRRRDPGLDLVARKKGRVPAFRSLDEIDGEEEVVLVLRQGGVISGAALDGSGRPVAGVHVRARSVFAYDVEEERETLLPGRDALGRVTTPTKEDGSFLLEGLAPGKRYLVDAFAEGWVTKGISIHGREHAGRREWIAPDQHDVQIRMTRVLVAIVGARVDGIDVTAGLGMNLVGDPSAVVYPAGCEGYPLLPLEWFQGELRSRLCDLHTGYHVLACTPRDGAASPASAEGEIRMGFFGGARRSFRVQFRSPGAPGWDEVQWLNVDDGAAPPLGEIVVVNDIPLEETPPLLLYSANWRPGDTGIFLRGAPEGETRDRFRFRAPEGRYRLLREGSAGYRVQIHAGRTEEFRTSFRRPHYLTVKAKYPSGGGAKEVAIYLRKPDPKDEEGYEWLRTILEPFGCRTGEERIVIRASDRGRVELLVKKAGFLPHTATLVLGAEDMSYQAPLELDPRYGWTEEE